MKGHLIIVKILKLHHILSTTQVPQSTKINHSIQILFNSISRINVTNRHFPQFYLKNNFQYIKIIKIKKWILIKWAIINSWEEWSRYSWVWEEKMKVDVMGNTRTTNKTNKIETRMIKFLVHKSRIMGKIKPILKESSLKKTLDFWITSLQATIHSLPNKNLS